MAVHHDKIRRILGENEERADNSLRAKSLERAVGTRPPRTLTPYEWEQWYAQHGIPDSHKGNVESPSWWTQLRALLPSLHSDR